jgi:hypothetical protein
VVAPNEPAIAMRCHLVRRIVLFNATILYNTIRAISGVDGVPLANMRETWKKRAVRFSSLSILAPAVALVLGPACGDGGGAGNSSAATASGSDASTASAGGSTSGTTSATPSTGAVDPTGGDPSAATTGAVDTLDSTTLDSTTLDSTTLDSTTLDSTTLESTAGETTVESTTGETTLESTTGELSTGDDGTTGIGGEANVLYVREDGQNGNPGTADLPLRTIQWAIDRAVEQGGIDTIRVAEGDYAVDYTDADHIVMAAGVSLYGGYRADWGERDPAQHVTRIVDETPVALPSSEANPHRALEIPADVGADTVLDGFHVGVARGQFRAALFVRGDATIRGNVIEPVVDATSVTTYGARLDHGSPTIVANRFRFAVVQDKGLSTAISAVESDGLFADNVIDTSGALVSTTGIWLAGGAAKILGNSIYLQHGGNPQGIYLSALAKPTIDNNLLEHEGFTGACIYSVGGAAVPAAARNNVLDCNYMLLGINPQRAWDTMMEFEAGLANAADNVRLAQNVVAPDDDMVLDAQSPCEVTQGGRDITADVPDDIDGVARTLPLSIGAHEWDGGCL